MFKNRLLRFSLKIKKRLLRLLKLHGLHYDMIYVYKMLSGLVDLNFDQYFALTASSTTRGHKYKLSLNTFSAKELSQYGIRWNIML